MSYLPKHTDIGGINFSITERCNRACPDCCYGIHILHPNVWELTEAAMEEAAGLLGHINLVTLTGGEPSFHRNFAALAATARRCFQTNILSIETNGYGFKRQPEVWTTFDHIYVTHYRAETYKNSPPNDGEIAFMREYLAEHHPATELFPREIDPHSPRVVAPDPRMCARGWNNHVTYFKGQIYGCCSAQGVEGAVGVPLDAEWRTRIMQQELPCARCLFANPGT